MNKKSICNILKNDLIKNKLNKKNITKPIIIHRIKYNEDNDSTHMDKKVSQKKLIKIDKIKYYYNMKNTHMDNKNFYLRHYKKNNIENFYLSNGCNKTLESGGGGTNSAITNISTEYFNTTYIQVIYDNQLDFNKIYSSEEQKVKFIQKKLKVELNAGSVLFSSYKHDYNGYNIKGVYHINAVDWKLNNIISFEVNSENTDIVKEYYIQIINHFIINSLNNSLLFLGQIPGFYFKGDIGTINGINNAIKEIQENINNKYSTNKNLTIVFDLKDI